MKADKKAAKNVPLATNSTETQASASVSPPSNELAAYVLLFLMLAVAALIVIHNLPNVDQYYLGADEGVYFRQATVIKNEGWAGFKTLAQIYKTDLKEQAGPNPLRISHICILTNFLKLHNSITTLSYYSLLTFLALGVTNFIFIKKWWNTQVALISTALLTYSPLTMGLARRALMDSAYFFFATLMLLLFSQFIQTRAKHHYYSFLAIVTFTLLYKESTFFILPFFIIVLLWQKFVQRDNQISYQHILGLAIVPGTITGLAYLLAFGNMELLFKLFEVTTTPNSAPGIYVLNYCSGPWYEYFIDFFIIAPFTSLLFFFYIGYYLINKERHQTINLLLGFLVYFIVVFSILPKNARYGINILFLYPLFAALMMAKLAESYLKLVNIRNLILTIATLVISIIGVTTYYRFFITNNIYDTVAINLFTAERFLPENLTQSLATNSSQSGDELYKMMSNVVTEPNENNYLALSVAYYKAGNYEGVISASENVIKLNPKNATAYNNICTAYGALKQWDKGIEACKKALEITPGYPVAQNNLTHLQEEKAKAANP